MGACSSCGGEIWPVDRFCGWCGHRLQRPAAAAPAPPSEPPPSSRPHTPELSGSTSASAGSTSASAGSTSASAGSTSASAGSTSASAGSTSASAGSTSASAGSTSASAAEVHAPSYSETVLFVIPESEGPKLLALLHPDALGHGIEVLLTRPRSALSQVQQRLRNAEASGDLLDAVCLIGDDARIPHVRFEDDTGHDDFLLTDNPYGQTSELTEAERYAGGIVDMLPVSRIPTVEPALVGRLLGVGNRLEPSWEGGVAVTAASWTEASQSVLDAVRGRATVDLLNVPPTSAQQVRQQFWARPGRVYFNVHGSDRSPDWFGDNGSGSTPTALTADAVQVRDHAIAMSESCYGALIQSPDEALSLAFLARGADAFVGSTIIAWGPARPPCSLADLVVQETYRALDSGCGLAAALLAARVCIADGYLSRGEALPPNALNTVASFVAYGAPLARVRGAVASAKRGRGPTRAGAPVEQKSAATGGVLDAVRQGMRQGTQGQLGAARQRYRQRLPPGAWKAFSRGRMTFGELSALVDEPHLLQARLSQLAGGAVGDAFVFQYASSKRFRAFVSVTHGERRAGVLLDDSGAEVEAWVSR